MNVTEAVKEERPPLTWNAFLLSHILVKLLFQSLMSGPFLTDVIKYPTKNNLRKVGLAEAQSEGTVHHSYGLRSEGQRATVDVESRVDRGMLRSSSFLFDPSIVYDASQT